MEFSISTNNNGLFTRFTLILLCWGIFSGGGGGSALTISRQQPPALEQIPSRAMVKSDNIGQLEGKAGYRMASLQWKFPTRAISQDSSSANNSSDSDSLPPVAFRVRYCERHNWGLHRCRYQMVDFPPSSNATTSHLRRHRIGRKQSDGGGDDDDSPPSSVENLLHEDDDIYRIDIGGLRMATNYSFEIIPNDLNKHGRSHGSPAQISLQTKGFSAKAKTCLADSSVVVVETGPFFGGRISVENASASASSCFIKGDPQSSETKYTLRIRHAECGSLVNDSKVTSVILVQENLPILTHSTRKFIVVCSFSPESFIVKAGVNLPGDASAGNGKGKSIDFSKLIRVSTQNSSLLMADKSRPGVGAVAGNNNLRPPKDNDTDPSSTQLDNNNNTDVDEESSGGGSQDFDSSNYIQSDEAIAIAQQQLPETTDNETGLPHNPTNKDSLIIPSSQEQQQQQLLETRQRQSRAYFHNNKNINQIPSIQDGKSPLSLVESENNNRGGKSNDGSVEGYLVFGMICIVIVSGLASVLWFIKSSYGNNNGVQPQSQQDDNSSITGGGTVGETSTISEFSSICNSFQIRGNNEELLSSSSTFDNQSAPNSLPGGRIPHNLDTRSELEVELDFEFSEEIHTPPTSRSSVSGNGGTTTPSNNNKRFTLELMDEQCLQLPSVSQA